MGVSSELTNGSESVLVIGNALQHDVAVGVGVGEVSNGHAIGRSLGQLSQADGAAAAGDVVDHDGAAQFLLHLSADRTASDWGRGSSVVSAHSAGYSGVTVWPSSESRP